VEVVVGDGAREHVILNLISSAMGRERRRNTHAQVLRVLHQLSRHVQRALALMLADVEHRQRVAVLAHCDGLLILRVYVEECEVFTNAIRKRGREVWAAGI
jgi:hypothetical protein